MRDTFARVVLVGLIAAYLLFWMADQLGRPHRPLERGTTEVAPALQVGTPWARYVAPPGTCRGADDGAAPAQQQLFAMRCLLDWARRERGLSGLSLNQALMTSAALKAATIARCNDFSHTPCGNDFRATFDAVGWRGGTGENIALGRSTTHSPRVLVDGWLHSDGHRKNLFTPAWRAQGLAVLQAKPFAGEGYAAIWVHQFGT